MFCISSFLHQRGGGGGGGGVGTQGYFNYFILNDHILVVKQQFFW